MINDNEQRQKIIKEFAEVINRNSLENVSDTPDFILGEYLLDCLELFELTYLTRANWYKVDDLKKKL